MIGSQYNKTTYKSLSACYFFLGMASLRKSMNQQLKEALKKLWFFRTFPKRGGRGIRKSKQKKNPKFGTFTGGRGGQVISSKLIWGPNVAVCDTLRHPFSPLDFLVKFILFSLKQLALFQIYNFFLQTQTLEISKLHDGVGGG